MLQLVGPKSKAVALGDRQAKAYRTSTPQLQAQKWKTEASSQGIYMRRTRAAVVLSH